MFHSINRCIGTLLMLFVFSAAAFGATAIYRSVGPGNFTALATGSDVNTLTVVDTIAVFSDSLPDNIGLGDALVYANDTKIVFVSLRYTNKVYVVKTATGGVPTSITGNADWKVYRAYNALRDALRGQSKVNGNQTIPSAIRNFDLWTAPPNLVTADQVWNFACYADAPEKPAADITIGGWVGDTTHYLRIFAPSGPNEVGVSQRHKGTLDCSKYHISYLTTAGSSAIFNITANYVRVDGLQFLLRNTGLSTSGQNCIVVTCASATQSDVRINGCILKQDTGSIGTYNRGLRLYAGVIKICNNIIWGMSGTTGGIGIIFQGSFTGQGYVANNLILNCREGITMNATPVLTNNILWGNTTQYTGNAAAASTNNAMSTGSISGTLNPIVLSSMNMTDYFMDDTLNFHLNPQAAKASEFIGKGADLSSDVSMAFNTDIDAQLRQGAWDVGPDQANGAEPPVLGVLGHGHALQFVSGAELSASPMQQKTLVRFSVPSQLAGARVAVSVYDIHGKLVRQIFKGTVTGTMTAQWKHVDLQGNAVRGGVYFVRMNAYNGQGTAAAQSTRVAIVR